MPDREPTRPKPTDAEAAAEANRWREEYEVERAIEAAELRAEHPHGWHGDLGLAPPPTKRLRFERLTYANIDAVVAAFAGDPDCFLDARFKSPEKYREYVRFLVEDTPWSRKHGAVDYVAFAKTNTASAKAAFAKTDGESAAVATVALQAVGVFHIYDLSREGFLDYPYRCTVGFAIGAAFRRKGYGAEGFAATLQHARDYFGKTRFLAMTAKGNKAAKGLLLGAGFAEANHRYDASSTRDEDFYVRYLGLPRERLPPGEYPVDWRADVDAVSAEMDALGALQSGIDVLRAWIDTFHEEQHCPSWAGGTVGQTLATLCALERRWALALELSARGLAPPPVLLREAGAGVVDTHSKREDPYPLELYRLDHDEFIEELSRLRNCTIDLLSGLTEQGRARVPDLGEGEAAGEVASPQAWAFRIAGRTLRLAAEMLVALPRVRESPYNRSSE